MFALDPSSHPHSSVYKLYSADVLVVKLLRSCFCFNFRNFADKRVPFNEARLPPKDVTQVVFTEGQEVEVHVCASYKIINIADVLPCFLHLDHSYCW